MRGSGVRGWARFFHFLTFYPFDDKNSIVSSYFIVEKRVFFVGIYKKGNWTLRLRDTSPTGQFAYCLVISPTRHFAYCLDSSPTIAIAHILFYFILVVWLIK